MIQVLVKTAGSSHRYCFICKLKSPEAKLSLVKKASVLKAYKDYRIFISSHARCCKDHLDLNGLIFEKCFVQIPTKLKKH